MASIPRLCQNPACGRPFTARPNDVARGFARFCSRQCRNVVGGVNSKRLHPQDGEANPNFKGWASRHKRVYVNRFRAKNPEKAQAHDALHAAIRRGQIVRPSRCEECGTFGPVHGHHEDYGRPLDVRFVCRPCHRRLDAARQARELLRKVG